ncbi:Sugar transporter [Tolypocladium paradoxum]|uniref:Sugar transporter n=1 Tax=Tolypocladium paradoxum TaxID=94208 RepID=A0A2S4KQR3_9HYPO|nr:Sugar transporter [Tolypocladium paradoxum]
MAVVKASRYNVLIAFFVTLGSFTYGYNSSVTAGVIGLPSFFDYLDIDVTTSTGNSILGGHGTDAVMIFQAINGVYLAGGAFGCWTLAWLADSIGRRRAIQVICILCIISAAIQCGSVHVAMFLVGRLLNGFGVGLITCVIPLYQSEISPPTQRGRLVGLHGFILVAGYSCGGWTSYGAYFTSNPALQWRLPLAIQIIAPLILICGSPWLPESPRWLISHGHSAQGMKILEYLHRTSEDPDATGAHDEFRQIQDQIELEPEHDLGSLVKCLQHPRIRKRMIYGFLLQWLLQSTGVLVVFNYQPQANINGKIGCIINLSVYTALVAEFADTTNGVGNGFAILCLFLFAVFYGGCLDASSYVYCSEIFPNSVRAHGVGFSISGLFLSNILYTQTAPTAFNAVGWKYFLVFILVPAVGLYPFVKYYPETKQLSLEEVDLIFLARMPSRNVYFTTGIACSTACMFGYGTGYIGGLLVLPSFNRRFALDGLSQHDRAAAQSLVVSTWLLGAFLGVISALPVCSRLGRQKCLLFCAITYVIGAVFQLVPSGRTITVFNIGRLLNGIGVGAGSLVTPLYISEISPPAIRGMLLASWQVSIQISALIGFWGAYISHLILPDTTDWQWAVPVIIQLFPGATLAFGILILPESPVWLAERHDLDSFRKTLAWLRQEDVSSPHIKSEVEEYYRTVADRNVLASRRTQSSFLKEICRRPLRKRLICGVGLMTLMTLSGTNALNFFAPVIFMSAGFTSTSASLFLTGLFGLVKLAAALGFMFYFVRVKGNRFWIIVATAVCSVSLFSLAFCVRRFEPEQIQKPYSPDNLNIAGVLACIMVFTFAFFFGIGHGPIAWAFCAEVFPAHLNTKCSAITACTQWLFQVVNAVATPLILATAGWYTWILFGCVNAFTLVWCILYLPETRGVPLGEPMDAAFRGNSEDKRRDVEHAENTIVPSEETSLLRNPRGI